jgi:hypothetical protein
VAQATRIENRFNILIWKMINYSEMPSYFWLVSPQLRKPVQDDVPYSTQALRQDLLRVGNAWDDCQENRERDAIYIYLTAVFDLVAWWVADNCAVERAQKALRLHNLRPSEHKEPFAAIIRCTADPGKVDKRPGPNGHGFCGTRCNTKIIPNRSFNSSNARAVSTNAHLGLRGCSVVVGIDEHASESCKVVGGSSQLLVQIIANQPWSTRLKSGGPL